MDPTYAFKKVFQIHSDKFTFLNDRAAMDPGMIDPGHRAECECSHGVFRAGDFEPAAVDRDKICCTARSQLTDIIAPQELRSISGSHFEHGVRAPRKLSSLSAVTRDRRRDVRISVKRFEESLDADPSTPSPTATPWSK